MNFPVALKYHGGQGRVANRIVSIAKRAEHLHYVEPYFGGGAVLFRKPFDGISEVVNDLDKDLWSFWKTLQGGKTFEQFRRLAEATPVCQGQWEDAQINFTETPTDWEPFSDDVVRAWQFFIFCRQSLAGRMKSFTPITTSRTRRGMNEQASAWLTAVEGLPDVHARLKRIVILNMPALDLIRQQDGPDTLFNIDPPFLPETRSSREAYRYEMTVEDHLQLLQRITKCEGKVMIAGYRSDLYDDYLGNWTRHDFDLPNDAAAGDRKRRMGYCLWCNFS